MANFKAEYAKLNAEQKRAVDTIEGPLLVVAGPGTGKTQLLSLRVANILRSTDVNPYNILCLTYTESGKDAMQGRLSQLLDNAAKKVEIHTFHGFGSRLITRFPDYFPELANFRSGEDLTLYETLYSCLERLPRNNPLSRHAYGEFVYQADARERISQLKRAGITPDAALQKAEADMDWCKSTGRKLTDAFNKVGRLSPKVAGALTAEVRPVLSSVPESELGRLCLDELQNAVSASAESGKATPLSEFKKRWFVSEEGKLHFKPIDQLKKLLALAELYKSYEDELKARNLFDYDDMILYALEKLKNNPGFLATVQETFQYILADEYQDTNAAQASIINLIAASPINEGRPNVMVVGDDDQAIYGFQGALGDVLMDFRERWRDVSVIILKSNYRSTNSILATSRAVITQGQNRLENYYKDIDKSLVSGVDYPDVAPVQFETSSPEAVLGKAVQAAKSHAEGSQLAIIATKHKYLQELADRLDAAKVDYYYEGREDLLKDVRVSSLLKLAGTASAIRQKDFMRTNFALPELIGLGVLTLSKTLAWEIALEAKTSGISWWQALNSSKHAQAKTAAMTLKTISQAIEPKDALSSLKDITKALNLRLLQKIRRLNDAAASYYGRNQLSLSELLRYTELCLQAGVTLQQKIVKGSPKAGVVLLSAHKSKGLEFDRVFVLHADFYTWFKEKGRNNKLSLPEGWKYLEPPATMNDDRLRLLYVVMTRARRELNLIKSRGQTEALPGLEDIKVEQYISKELETFDLQPEQTWRSWYLPKTSKEMSELKRLLKPMLTTYRLSSSHLTTFLDVAHDGSTTFFTRILLGISEPVNPEAIFGSRVHRVISFAQDRLNKTGNLPTKKQLEAYVKEQIVADAREALDIVETVDGFLRHSHILMSRGVSEYSFSSSNITVEGKRLTGTVDHFVLNGSRLTLTDFKTGRALNSWHIREDYYKQKLHKFRQQLMFYELLFRLAPKFSNLTTVDSKIAFVEPTRRDTYYELTLDASDKERSQLENLITVVWQKIMKLDLPDVSKYSKDAQGTLDFEEDLIKGQI